MPSGVPGNGPTATFWAFLVSLFVSKILTLLEYVLGFKNTHPTYTNFSTDFFDHKHFVLVGGSWATDRRLVRRSFRNFFQGRYPYVELFSFLRLFVVPTCALFCCSQ